MLFPLVWENKCWHLCELGEILVAPASTLLTHQRSRTRIQNKIYFAQ